MNESTFPTKGRELDPTALDAMGREPPGALETKPGDPNPGRVRRILPWVIAAVAVLVAAIATGVLVVNESSEPRPVAQLTAQSDPTPAAVPIDKEVAQEWGVTNAHFVSYGSYGAAEIWSTTTPGAKRCLAVVVEDHTWMFRCTPPTFDTIAEIDIDPVLVPPAPTGEPAANVQFVLHDDVVDVYLAPNPEGGFY
ncbi:hypothetical protein [Cryobacterium sp. N22]|uniref:hypothetical protein n=1 Tax=Cryobacterium sp. N22 TaxID=2048290 RepID=UPI000CE4CBC2|nr:hypothetical protein [Cryobacterium sp. N22]